jgi:hypothetical protein
MPVNDRRQSLNRLPSQDRSVHRMRHAPTSRSFLPDGIRLVAILEVLLERRVEFANVMPESRDLPEFSRLEFRRILMRKLRNPLQVRDKIVPLPVRLRRRMREKPCLPHHARIVREARIFTTLVTPAGPRERRSLGFMSSRPTESRTRKPRYFGSNLRAAELMQYRWPVGAGPSSKMWP